MPKKKRTKRINTFAIRVFKFHLTLFVQPSMSSCKETMLIDIYNKDDSLLGNNIKNQF